MAELGTLSQMPERKPDSKWMDPRFLAAMLSIFIGLIGIYIGSRMTASVQAVQQEARNKELADSARALTAQAKELKDSQASFATEVRNSLLTQSNDTKNSLAQITGLVNQFGMVTTETKAKVEQAEKEITRLNNEAAMREMTWTAYKDKMLERLTKLEAERKP